MSLTTTPGAIPEATEADMLANLPPAGNKYFFYDLDQSGNLYSIDSAGVIKFVALAGSVECCTCCLAEEWMAGLNEALNNGAIDGDQYNEAVSGGFYVNSSNDGQGNCTIFVGRNFPRLTGISIVPKTGGGTAAVAVHGTIQLGIVATPLGANPAVVWVPTDPTKVTVSSSGLAYGVAGGSSVVTAYSVEDATIKDTVNVIVG